MSMESRLRRLEECQSAGRCQECGFPPDSEGTIVLIDEERPEESFDGDPDERCSRCGRHLWCVIEVVYGSPSEAGHEGGGGKPYWPDAAR
jgi:ribosomal protein S14